MEMVIRYTNEDLVQDFTYLRNATPRLPVGSRQRSGMKILEHFQPHLWETRGANGNSVAELWNDEALMKKVIDNDRTFKRVGKLYVSEIRRNLAFYGNAPLPTMYRPLLTKAIVRKYNATTVLDPCVGWGGRLLGCLAAGVRFTGIEPSTKTHEGLRSIVEMFGKDQSVTLFKEGAENVLPSLPSESFDMILTSPPYFDLEIYCDEETQSVKKFSTWEAWLSGFLEPIIRECLRCLKEKGVSAWSVKNMGTRKLETEVKAIHKKYGYDCVATEGMTAPARNRGRKARMSEETFIFQKNILGKTYDVGYSYSAQPRQVLPCQYPLPAEDPAV